MATKIYDAVHEIHLTKTPGKPGDKAKCIAPTRPEVTTIPAGSKFTMDDDDDRLQGLKDAGACLVSDSKKERGIEKVEKPGKAAKKATPAKAAKNPDDKGDSGKAADKGDEDKGDDANSMV